jgi:hypothetical protein
MPCLPAVEAERPRVGVEGLTGSSSRPGTRESTASIDLATISCVS